MLNCNADCACLSVTQGAWHRCFEVASLPDTTPEQRKKLLSFIVVGAPASCASDTGTFARFSLDTDAVFILAQVGETSLGPYKS